MNKTERKLTALANEVWWALKYNNPGSPDHGKYAETEGNKCYDAYKNKAEAQAEAQAEADEVNEEYKKHHNGFFTVVPGPSHLIPVFYERHKGPPVEFDEED